MNNVILDIEDDIKPKHRSHFNKEVSCKKNKLGGGRYGLHIYENGNCINCGKIDPRKKRRNYDEHAVRSDRVEREEC
jgi:hypothetical protein